MFCEEKVGKCAEVRWERKNPIGRRIMVSNSWEVGPAKKCSGLSGDETVKFFVLYCNKGTGLWNSHQKSALSRTLKIFLGEKFCHLGLGENGLWAQAAEVARSSPTLQNPQSEKGQN